VPTADCPRCGYQQEGGEECQRCGIIFERYRGTNPKPHPAPDPGAFATPFRPRPKRFRRFYRAFRWVSLAGLVVGIVLILRPSPAPAIVTTPEALHRAEAKVQEFHASKERGRPGELNLDESELNGWLGANLALKKPENKTSTIPVAAGALPADLAKKAIAAQPEDNPTVEEVQSSVRDIKIELEGQLLVRDGCLRLEPTSGKLGSLPLMQGTLQSAAYRLFDSPENKEQFRLPPEIRDVRVERGRLIVSSQ